MIHLKTLSDLSQILDDPYLWREVYGFLSVCTQEIREYGDEDDLIDHDFNLVILDTDELDYLADLGKPEETAVTRIECCGEVRIFRRLVYPIEIVLIDESHL